VANLFVAITYLLHTQHHTVSLEKKKKTDIHNICTEKEKKFCKKKKKKKK
jgi:hypothetical protein